MEAYQAALRDLARATELQLSIISADAAAFAAILDAQAGQGGAF